MNIAITPDSATIVIKIKSRRWCGLKIGGLNLNGRIAPLLRLKNRFYSRNKEGFAPGVGLKTSFFNYPKINVNKFLPFFNNKIDFSHYFFNVIDGVFAVA